MSKELHPVNILVKGLDTRSPEDLLGNEFRQSKRLYSGAVHLSNLLIPNLVVHDPHGILAETRGTPVVHGPRHLDGFDILAMGASLRRAEHSDPRYIAMAELFGPPEGSKNPLLYAKARATSLLIRRLGGIPVDRKKAKEMIGVKALLNLSKYIINHERQSLVVFPEGGYADGRTVTDVSTGAADIARVSKVPLVIWGIAGTEGATRKALHGRRPDQVVAHVHAIVDPSNEKIKVERLRQLLQTASDEAFELLLS